MTTTVGVTARVVLKMTVDVELNEGASIGEVFTVSAHAVQSRVTSLVDMYERHGSGGVSVVGDPVVDVAIVRAK